MPRAAARSASMVLAVLIVAALAACGAAGSLRSFDPASACTTDGRMPGAYPDLEALLPARYEGAAPASVDSGRSCTKEALGALADAGIDGVRFAGATWPLGGSTALTVAVFEAKGLQPATMIDFYAAGAQVASRTDKLSLTETTAGGRPARELDVLRNDGTGQSIVAWPDGPDRVMVLLASDLGAAKVAEAANTFAAP